MRELISVKGIKKIKIDNTQVFGLEASFRGMRNPMNSHHLSDSFTFYPDIEKNDNEENFLIGQKDLFLAQKLICAGNPHCKFLRQIHVWADVSVPRYLWSEWDTYHFNTKNSESTMHRLLNNKNEITLDLFLFCEEEEDIMQICVDRLELLRKKYMEMKNTQNANKDEMNRLIIRAKRLLMEGFIQLRTLDTTYEELRNIYFQRKDHRLKEEWQDTVCKWIESLPYAKELIMFTGNKNEFE